VQIVLTWYPYRREIYRRTSEYFVYSSVTWRVSATGKAELGKQKKEKHRVKQSNLQAWRGREGSSRLRIPDFKKIEAWRSNVVSLMHRSSLSPQKLLLVFISVRGGVDRHSAARTVNKNYNDNIENRTRDLWTYSAVTLPAAPPRAPP
jgi:hypothetical protein